MRSYRSHDANDSKQECMYLYVFYLDLNEILLAEAQKKPSNRSQGKEQICITQTHVCLPGSPSDSLQLLSSSSVKGLRQL